MKFYSASQLFWQSLLKLKIVWLCYCQYTGIIFWERSTSIFHAIFVFLLTLIFKSLFQSFFQLSLERLAKLEGHITFSPGKKLTLAFVGMIHILDSLFFKGCLARVTNLWSFVCHDATLATSLFSLTSYAIPRIFFQWSTGLELGPCAQTPVFNADQFVYYLAGKSTFIGPWWH